MSYGVRYILSLLSDRGNDIRIEILEKGFSGTPEQKSLGGAPSLVVEEADGGIKGSSLAMAVQADVEGELKNLYTTDNRKFRVDLYRNSALYWQGYLMPELYSENYVDPPFDVSVTASDQLGALKNISYKGDDVNVSLLEVIESILAQTSLDLPFKLHLQIAQASGTQPSLLRTAYINAATFNGYNCYDALNAILLSCNCTIMQLGCSWLIASKTDATTVYDVDGQMVQQDHCAIDSMHKGEVWPSGSLNMVNVPAVKGVEINYSHILKNSFLSNAECSSKDGWLYTITNGLDLEYPMEFQAYSKIYKAYAWRVSQKDVQKDWALQVWQDVYLEEDASTVYKVSVDHLFGPRATTLLLAIVHEGNDGITRRLTAEGWVSNVLAGDPINYIQITGEGGKNQLTAFDVANKSLYTTSSVTFTLPAVAGTLRIGFINTTTEGAEPANNGEIYFTNVFFTVDNITGKTSTTLVQENATVAQQGVELSYGDPAQGANAHSIVLNTLTDAQGGQINYWYLQSRQYLSYYALMEQEWSRYYGSKKMQLQGALMGGDVLHPYYTDAFSGRVFRLCQGDYNLLSDEISVTLEEVITGIVSYQTTVYATDNTSGQGGTSSGGATVAGGGMGDSYLQLQSDGDVNVKNARPLTGFEARFEQWAVPKVLPADPRDGERYIYLDDTATADDELKADAINLKVVLEKLKRFERMWKIDAENDAVRTTFNLIVEKGVSFGAALGEVTPGGGSGGGAGLTTFDIIVNGQRYPLQGGVVQLPDYPVVPNVSGLLSKEEARDLYQPKGNYLTAVPSEYVTEDELSSKGYITNKALDGYATESWVARQGFLKEHQSLAHLLSKEEARDLYQPKGNYASAAALENAVDAHNALRTEFDDLSNLLNSDVSGKINTWNEVVDFLDEYSGSQDLATILSGINADVAKRALQTNLDSAVARVKTLEDTIKIEQGYIETLQGYFTDGKANKAIADGNGDNIVDTYATKVALKEIADKVATLQDMWSFDEAHANTIKTIYNVVVDEAISFGGYGESSGSGGGITTVTKQMILDALEYTPYDAANPKGYITSSALSGYAKLSDIPSLEGYATLEALSSLSNKVDDHELRIAKLENLWHWSDEHNAVETDHSVVVKKAISFGGAGSSSGGNGGGITSITYDMVVDALGYTPYNAANPNGYVSSSVAITTANIGSQSVSYANNAGYLQGKTFGQWNGIAYNGGGVLEVGKYIDFHNSASSTADYDTRLVCSGATGNKLTLPTATGTLALTSQFADYQPLSTAINTGNIGSQSVNYANSAGNATNADKLGYQAPSYYATAASVTAVSNRLAPFETYITPGPTTTVDASLTVKSLTISSASAEAHISMSRSGINYFKAISAGGSFGFICNAKALQTVNADLVIEEGYLYPGSTGATSMGRSSKRWSFVYSVDGNFSGSVSMGGNLVVSGSITFGSASDRRLKDNIQSMTDKQAIAVLSALNPVTFTWNSTANQLDSQLKGVSDGFIADEYEKVIANSGRDIWANYRAIDYKRATGYLVKGWQNHETRLEKAERRIKELENELKQYRRA